jgi:hypothetical protein
MGETGVPGMPGGTSGTGQSNDFSANAGGQGDGTGGGQGGLESAGGSAVGGETFIGAGYVDTAIPLTQYRLRVDAANGDNRPDRADYFYPKCGCFRTLAAKGLPGGDPNAPGPGTVPASNVNFQQLFNTLEIALNRRFSVWVDVPIRWVDINFSDPTAQTQYNSGLSDIQFGFKAAVLYEASRVLTFQLRTYAPSGNASLGLGRNNWNVEPGLLYYQRLSSRLFFEGEILDFIPVASADDFAGNVLQWGGALSYLIYNQPNFRVAPVTELVGWNVLSGKELADSGPVSAAGDTIVNAKFGVRVGFGQLVQPGFINRADVYVGYGRALTGEVWYKNMFRSELRLRF